MVYAQNCVASVFTPVGCSSSVAVSSVADEMKTSANAAPRPGAISGSVTRQPDSRRPAAKRAPDLLQARRAPGAIAERTPTSASGRNRIA